MEVFVQRFCKFLLRDTMNALQVTFFKIFPWKCDRRPLRGDPAATCVPAAWVILLLGASGGSGVGLGGFPLGLCLGGGLVVVSKTT